MNTQKAFRLLLLRNKPESREPPEAVMLQTPGTNSSTSHPDTALPDSCGMPASPWFMYSSCCSTAKGPLAGHSHHLYSDAVGSALFCSCLAGSPNPTAWTELPSLGILLVLEFVPPTRNTEQQLCQGLSGRLAFPCPTAVKLDIFSMSSSSVLCFPLSADGGSAGFGSSVAVVLAELQSVLLLVLHGT